MLREPRDLPGELAAPVLDLREQQRAFVELAGHPFQVASSVVERELDGVQRVDALVVVVTPFDELARELAHGEAVEQHPAALRVLGIVGDHAHDVAQIFRAREPFVVRALAYRAEVRVAHAGGEDVVVFQDLRHRLFLRILRRLDVWKLRRRFCVGGARGIPRMAAPGAVSCRDAPGGTAPPLALAAAGRGSGTPEGAPAAIYLVYTR